MFKILTLILFFIVAICFGISLVQGADVVKRKPTDWQPMYGFNSPSGQAFVDANSREIFNVDSHHKYNSAEILISFNDVVEVTTDGKNYSVRSVVRHLVAECDSGLMAPVFDIYFTEAVPTRDSTPVTGTQWPTDVRQTSTILSKNSVLYTTLCPMYI